VSAVPVRADDGAVADAGDRPVTPRRPGEGGLGHTMIEDVTTLMKART
jgi:hypothetical protein